ncbi:MAG: ABC transporter permease [Clostridium sp.]|jgi:ABC-2 type transport system permease protein
MRTFWIYLQLEIKRTLKSIPAFLAGAAVLAVLTGAVAFSAAKALYGKKAVDTISVGVVMPEEDRLARLAVDMVSSLDSVGSLCEFTYMEAETGRKKLKNGEILALMEIPEGLVESIMDGENLPVVIYFPEYAGLEAAVLRELTGAATSMLSVAQSGIYAADDYLRSHGLEAEISQAEGDLNRIFMSYALSREAYFREKTVSASGNVPVPVYYGISAAVFLLLLMGIPASPLLRPAGSGLEQGLARMGIGRGLQTLVRVLDVFLLLGLLLPVPVWAAWKHGYLAGGVSLFLVTVLSGLTAAGWIVLFYELCRSSSAAILALFTVTTIMLFVSGGIVPSVFLPEPVRALGDFTVTGVLADSFLALASGMEGFSVFRLGAMTAAILALAVAVGTGRE